MPKFVIERAIAGIGVARGAAGHLGEVLMQGSIRFGIAVALGALTLSAAPAGGSGGVMASAGLRSRLPRRRIALGALVIAAAASLTLSAGAVAASGGNSAATITGSFADSCRDFSAHSSKDISHVEIHYADGRVVKDESTTTPNFAIDGVAGDEIEFALVKSGTTRKSFTCPRTNSPPTAVLEINGPCGTMSDGTLSCDADVPRSDWVWLRPGNGFVFWGCNDTQFCLGTPTDPGFRATSSTDPEGDIVSWSIDFGDGTSAAGSWATIPPAELVHAYPPFPDAVHISPTVTLTVTDSAGQSDSDAMTLVFMTPD